MYKHIIYVLIFILISCNINNQKENETIIDTNDSISYELNNREFDKNDNLDKELKSILEAKPGETIVINDYDRLNNHIKNKLKTESNEYYNSKGIIKDLDFEFSDNLRKEAFKETRQYLASQISKNECKLLSQSLYNSNKVRYIGGSGYIIKIICRYDCNQDYINEVIFYVETFYTRNNNWKCNVIKQSHND